MEDLKTANFLDSKGYAYKFVKAVSLKLIDMDEARANPARLTKKLDDDRVLQYSLAMLDGVDFPAIVVIDTQGANQLYGLITGRHRYEAAMDAGLKTLDAYVVREADAYRCELLLRTINNIEGRAPSVDEKLAHLFELHRKHGVSIRELAKEFGMKQGTVNDYMRADNTRRRAERLYVSERLSRFPKTVCVDLDKVKNDNTFAAALEVLHKFWPLLKGSQAKALVLEVAACTTEEKAKKLLADRVSELRGIEEELKAKSSRAPRGAATSFMGRIRSLVKRHPRVEELHLDGLPAASLPGEQRILEQAIDVLSEAFDCLTVLIAQHKGEAEWRSSSDKKRPGEHGSEGISLSI